MATELRLAVSVRRLSSDSIRGRYELLRSDILVTRRREMMADMETSMEGQGGVVGWRHVAAEGICERIDKEIASPVLALNRGPHGPRLAPGFFPA